MIDTTERLALALEELNDPSLAEMIENARLGDYDDYLAKSSFAITQLVADLEKLGHNELAKRITKGEFDASQEEHELWERINQAEADRVAARIAEDIEVDALMAENMEIAPLEYEALKFQ
jgi:hypothetical protein